MASLRRRHDTRPPAARHARLVLRVGRGGEGPRCQPVFRGTRTSGLACGFARSSHAARMSQLRKSSSAVSHFHSGISSLSNSRNPEPRSKVLEVWSVAGFRCFHQWLMRLPGNRSAGTDLSWRIASMPDAFPNRGRDRIDGQYANGVVGRLSTLARSCATARPSRPLLDGLHHEYRLEPVAA
jgi:hypothetical protein